MFLRDEFVIFCQIYSPFDASPAPDARLTAPAICVLIKLMIINKKFDGNQVKI